MKESAEYAKLLDLCSNLHSQSCQNSTPPPTPPILHERARWKLKNNEERMAFEWHDSFWHLQPPSATSAHPCVLETLYSVVVEANELTAFLSEATKLPKKRRNVDSCAKTLEFEQDAHVRSDQFEIHSQNTQIPPNPPLSSSPPSDSSLSNPPSTQLSSLQSSSTHFHTKTPKKQTKLPPSAINNSKLCQKSKNSSSRTVASVSLCERQQLSLGQCLDVTLASGPNSELDAQCDGQMTFPSPAVTTPQLLPLSLNPIDNLVYSDAPLIHPIMCDRVAVVEDVFARYIGQGDISSPPSTSSSFTPPIKLRSVRKTR